MDPKVRASVIPPAFMESMDSLPMPGEPPSLQSLPDLTVTTTAEKFTSLKLCGNGSFLLLDAKEHLKISSAEKFSKCLGSSDPTTKVKVVSIVGNSGDGKSHTLNKVFFKGDEVFKTSSEQLSCTMGVWAAFDPCLNVIVLDTEGLLGTTSHENQRTRLLLKVLAVSDVVIYRTRSERLHTDMFTFLGSASRAFSQHFQGALATVSSRGGFGVPISTLGPAVIIFQETQNTVPLKPTPTESVEDLVRAEFSKLHLKTDAFSSLRYIGTQTKNSSTNFNILRDALCCELNNTSVRSARQTDIVYQALKVLNDKFSGEIVDAQPMLFPDQYFTCASKCLSCNRRCEASMGHLMEGQPHLCKQRCSYQAQYNNMLYICKACHTKGQQVVVTETEASWLGIAKQAWTGSTINCPHCGEIYRSRQYWYGNKSPEESAVRTEITHVWNNTQITSTQNAAQRVVDGVTFISETFASVGSQPTRYVSSWLADQFAPKYWTPNDAILSCHGCKKAFSPAESKHHCRSCGEGFCEHCTSHTRIVPEKGWMYPVKVCDACYFSSGENDMALTSSRDDVDIRARQYGEVVVSAISTVAAALKYPKELIKSKARPSYWVPDEEATNCAVCNTSFGSLVSLHHCRDCGKAVCHPCSMSRRPVLTHGWESPVRVCDQCMKKD